MCQSEAFSLSKKLFVKLGKDVIHHRHCGLHAASGENLFSQLKRKFQRKSGLILATGIGETKLPLSHGIILSLSREEMRKIHLKKNNWFMKTVPHLVDTEGGQKLHEPLVNVCQIN